MTDLSARELYALADKHDAEALNTVGRGTFWADGELQRNASRFAIADALRARAKAKLDAPMTPHGRSQPDSFAGGYAFVSGDKGVIHKTVTEDNPGTIKLDTQGETVWKMKPDGSIVDLGEAARLGVAARLKHARLNMIMTSEHVALLLEAENLLREPLPMATVHETKPPRIVIAGVAHLRVSYHEALHTITVTPRELGDSYAEAIAGANPTQKIVLRASDCHVDMEGRGK